MKFPKALLGRVKRGLKNWVLVSIRDIGISREGSGDQRLAAAFNLTLLTRFAVSAVGAATIAIGATMTIKAGIGVGPFDVLITGVANIIGVAPSVAVWVVTASLSTILLLLRGRPTLGGLYAALVSGASFFAAFALVPGPDSLAQSIFMLVLGLAVLVCGIEIAAVSGLGRAVNELLAMRIAELSGLDVRVARSLQEVSFLSVGWLLGGQVGVGTAVVAFSIGPALAVANSVIHDIVVGRRARVGSPDELSAVALNVPLAAEDR